MEFEQLMDRIREINFSAQCKDSGLPRSKLDAMLKAIDLSGLTPQKRIAARNLISCSYLNLDNRQNA